VAGQKHPQQIIGGTADDPALHKALFGNRSKDQPQHDRGRRETKAPNNPAKYP
jgi:hypothetical protein